MLHWDCADIGIVKLACESWAAWNSLSPRCTVSFEEQDSQTSARSLLGRQIALIGINHRGLAILA